MHTITLTTDQLDMLRTAVLNQIERQQAAQREFAETLPTLAEAEGEREQALQAINAIINAARV